jgi:hypothetical protein
VCADCSFLVNGAQLTDIKVNMKKITIFKVLLIGWYILSGILVRGNCFFTLSTPVILSGVLNALITHQILDGASETVSPREPFD